MKLFVVLGLVACAFAVRNQWENEEHRNIRHSSFLPHKEYRFNWDGQVVSGLPTETSSDHSATRIQARLSVVFENDRNVLLKFNKVRLGSLQKDLVEPRNVEDFARFEEIEMTKEQESLLLLPIRFHYQHGIVSELEFDREDQTWSENIKRAVVNMLQINMLKKGRNDLNEVNRLVRDEEETEYKNNEFFTVQEKTLEGDCELAYTMIKRGEEEMHVTKSINFEKCNQRSGLRYNFRFGETCGKSCDQKFVKENRNLESTTVFNYNISGTPEQFLINEVEVRSQYVFVPMNEGTKMLITYVSNKLTLIETLDKETRIERPSSDKKHSLIYSDKIELLKEQFHMNGDETYLRHLPYTKVEGNTNMVFTLLKQLVHEMTLETGVEVEATHVFSRLVTILRGLSKSELTAVYREVFESEKFEKVSAEQAHSLFIDALAHAGSKICIDKVLELISSRKVNPIKSAQLMNTIINTPTPSEKIIESILRVCREEVAERNPILRQSCWLTTGALIGSVCSKTSDLFVTPAKEMCPRQLKEKYVKLMSHQFEKAQTRYEKVLALKTIANSGLDLAVFDLEKIIYDRAEERTVRMQAIDALRLIRNQMPRKIQNILMPIYKSRSELPELRMSALYQIMQTQPERMLIEQLVSQMESERVEQVRAFTYTTLSTMAASTTPCEKRVSEDINVVLRNIREPTKYLTSRHHHLPLYSEDMKTGFTFDFASLFTNESVLPKEIMASVHSLIGGEWFKQAAQFGLYQQNIDKILIKALNKIEETENLEEIIVRGKRSSTIRASDILRSMIEKMNIKTRTTKDSDAHALVYVRVQNLDRAFVPIEEETIPALIKAVFRNGKLQIGEIERMLTQGYRFRLFGGSHVYDMTRKIATSIGMPLVLNGKLSTVYAVHGNVKFDLEPKNADHFHGLRMRIAAQPSIATTNVFTMTISSPLVSTGVKSIVSAKLHMPVDLELETNWEKTFQVKTVVKALEQEKRVLSIHSRPVTFVRVWPKQIRNYIEAKEKTVYVAEIEMNRRNVDYTTGKDLTGLQMNVRGNIYRHMMEKQSSSLPLFWGVNHMEIIVRPTEETPRQFVFKMDVETFKQVNRMDIPEMSNFFEERKNQELFTVEDSEYRTEEESERRISFNKYTKNYRAEKAYNHRVWLKYETQGSTVERKAELELGAVCDNNVRFCKVMLDVRRSPLAEETREWELKTVIQTLYPEVPKTFEKLLEQIHREFHATVETKWGAEKKNVMNLKIQGEQNKEGKKWMKIVEKKMHQLQMFEKLNEAAQLNQYKIVADYKLTPITRVYLSKVLSLLQSYNFWNTEMLLSENEQKNVFIQLTVEPETRRYVNLTIQTPVERMLIKDIRMPFAMPSQRIITERSVENWRDVSLQLTEERLSECKVTSKKVRTFDEVLYKAPLTTCYSVLAKDCQEEPKFAVLIKKNNKRGEEKKLKIINRQNVYEIELIEEELVVKVNNKMIKDEEKLTSYGIEKLNNNMYKIDLDDVIIRFDGFNAQIRLSDLYKNKQCGLCGHFDGERTNEFRRYDNELTDDVEEFHRGYLSRDEECDIEESRLSDKKNYKQYNKESEIEWENERYYETEDKIVEPELKTRVLEYSDRICFSMKPVKECPRKTDATELREESVEFTCLKRSSEKAHHLLREVRREIVSLENYTVSFEETLRVPKTCVVY